MLSFNPTLLTPRIFNFLKGMYENISKGTVQRPATAIYFLLPCIIEQTFINLPKGEILSRFKSNSASGTLYKELKKAVAANI